MISQIQGKLVDIKSEERCDRATILLSIGLAYDVYVAKENSLILNTNVSLYTADIIREDSQTLYGFVSKDEKELFDLLISVSGVGPKSAISIFSKYQIGQIKKIIASEDDKALSSVSGIGTKGAKKILIELKDKVVYTGYDKVLVSQDTEILHELEVALKTLGFERDSIKECVENANKLLETEKHTIEELIKISLASR